MLTRRRHEGLVPDGRDQCLYEQYGFRPDIIAGTSVGAINGIKLACAPPLAVNDAEAILTAVAAGSVDPQLAHMRELKQTWLAADGRDDFFLLDTSYSDGTRRRRHRRNG